MNASNINYDEKIITPTKELYQHLSQQANELFERAAISGNELHASIASASTEFYNMPVETSLRWKSEIADKGNEFYTYLNTDIIPSAQADYQQFISTASDYNTQAQDAIQFFIDHPKMVTLDTFNMLNQSVNLFIDSSINISAKAIDSLSLQATHIIDFLSNQPIQGLENLYYETLALLLNSYFSVISSLLINV